MGGTMTEDQLKYAFMNDLHELLEKYGAELEAADHWTGYAECGSDIRMTVTIQGIYNEGEVVLPFVQVDLGRWVCGNIA
jgi:hypothetical protein